jgi:hypothetical protein
MGRWWTCCWPIVRGRCRAQWAVGVGRLADGPPRGSTGASLPEATMAGETPMGLAKLAAGRGRAGCCTGFPKPAGRSDSCAPRCLPLADTLPRTSFLPRQTQDLTTTLTKLARIYSDVPFSSITVLKAFARADSAGPGPPRCARIGSRIADCPVPVGHPRPISVPTVCVPGGLQPTYMKTLSSDMGTILVWQLRDRIPQTCVPRRRTC